MRGIKKTTEQYKLELDNVNKKNGTNIKLRDKYIKDDVKIIHICTCGREWNVAPTTVLQGSAKSCGLCYSLTFEQWCLNNNYQDLLDRWDYELNNCKPSEITHRVNKKYYFKCPRRLHKSELKIINNFTNRKDGTMDCRKCKSFAQYNIDNLGEDFLDKYWDWEKNNEIGIDPWKISYGSSDKKVWIKCQEKNYHGSYDIKCYEFTSGGRCSYCHSKKIHPKDSFAQYLIDTYGENALELYWDYKKNNIDPWKTAKASPKQKIYIICQEKDYHGSYKLSTAEFINGQRCSFCQPKSGKVHPLDSLGMLYPQVLNIWSDRNKKSPYKYTPYANQEVYWKCPEGKHKDYPRKISNSNICCFRCPECQYSKGEEKISDDLINKGFIKISQKEFNQSTDENKYNKNYYVPQKEFKGLLGTGGGLLSYDFYLPKLNLLIEFHGEQHERYVPGFHETYDNFLKQLEHDKRKCEYAINNNINLLIIWYWDFDKIEEILEREVFIHI